MSFQLGKETWQIASISKMNFLHIAKEKETHGKIYAANCLEGNAAFVGQSIPALCKMIFEICKQKCYPSSFYRLLRGDQQKPHKRKWLVKHLGNAQELNEFLAPFMVVYVCSKNLYLWQVEFLEEPSNFETLNVN